MICDPLGGINAYRSWYRCPHAVRFHSTAGDFIDEPALHSRWSPTSPRAGGLRIVLAGELAYNPERILALEERGHVC